jgi:hypothetical protein
MKLNGYTIIEQVLEARFNLKSSKNARVRVVDLKKKYQEERDPSKRRNLLRQIKKAQSDMALMPNKSYSMYRTY